MSITDELRTWIRSHYVLVGGMTDLTAIADRIDAEAEDNESFRSEAEQFCDRLKEASAERADVTLFGVDYMALPTDADGVPICVGDVMENVVYSPTHREVTAVGVKCFYAWDDGNSRYSQFDANRYRHYHEPTVEDVLDEIVDKANSIGCAYAKNDISGEEMMGALQAIVAEYAAKLRLAGDGE